MPRLPRISGQEAIQALKKLGFDEARQKGSHVVLRKDHIGCVIPLHKELKVGTLAGALRQADVSVEEFLSAL